MDMPRLRSTLTRLRAIPFRLADDYNEVAAPQEMLDFLAMMAGLTPVYLLGRGMDDPGWVAGVTKIVRELKMHVVRGPWFDVPFQSVLPEWYRTEFQDKLGGTAVYVTKSPATSREVAAVCGRNGILTVAEEARLLGYPVCCVEDHYARQAAMDKLFGSLLARTSGGDEGKMRQIARNDVQMTIETEEEHALHQRVTTSKAIPYTSVMACPACAAADNSPAKKMGAKYQQLAEAIGRGLPEDVLAGHNAMNEDDPE